MIHYQLRCAGDHEFDGWFRDSAGFDEQAATGQLSCPICGDGQVRRAPMAPRIARRAKARPVPAPAAPPPAAPPPWVPAMRAAPPGSALPAAAIAALQRIRADVERRCEYVGPEFAAEARRIHEGSTPARSIYGEATPDQAEALREDGIAVADIPWLPRADS